jgi:hypothetical protein
MSLSHPGTIVFEDMDLGTSKEVSAETVPHGVAWARVSGEEVAVVRVESHTRGPSRVIRSYGCDGALVFTTRQKAAK